MSRSIIIGSIELRRAVWRQIAPHKGAGNEIKAPVIGERLGLSEVQVRMIVKAIIEEEGQVICSNGNGFFIPITADEALKYAESLKSRIISINKRLNSLKSLIPRKFFDNLQAELFK